MTDTVIYDFLEHRGVKGMRWGVRKDRTSDSKSSRNKKIAIGAGVGVALVGATVAGVILKNKGKTPISSLQNLPNAKEKYDSARQLITDNYDVKTTDIKKLASAGKITSDQSKRVRDLASRDWVNRMNVAYRESRRG